MYTHVCKKAKTACGRLRWGFRLNSLPDLVSMSERISVFEADFQQGDRKDIPAMRQFKLRALRAGVVHAVVSSWEVWSDAQRTHKITTHPEPWAGPKVTN